jgi:phosphoesterase RecJ-like protein
MPTPDAWTPTLDRLRAAKSLWLVTHERPDPDGLGATLGLREALEQLGKSVRAFAPHETPAPYRLLKGWERLEVANDKAPTGDAPDLVVLVDANQSARTGRWAHAYDAVSLDHHGAQDDSILGIIEPHRSSASELIVDVVEALGAHLTPTMAHNLYTGIVFDTRSFRFLSGNAGALLAAAKLIPFGLDLEQIFDALFAAFPPGFLELTRRFLDDLHTELDGRFTWGVVDMKLVQDLGVDKALIQELLPFMLMVADVKVAILYRQLENKQYKASLRSKGTLDVRALSMLHGGGGHRNASGVTLNMTPDQHLAIARPWLLERLNGQG